MGTSKPYEIQNGCRRQLLGSPPPPTPVGQVFFGLHQKPGDRERFPGKQRISHRKHPVGVESKEREFQWEQRAGVET
jgi:hypothetical protein